MKIAQYIIVFVLAIYAIIRGTNWKSLNKLHKFFVILAVIGFALILINSLRDHLDENSINHSLDYLKKNKASLNSYLYIDTIKDGALYYHLEITNKHLISAKNISYTLVTNDEAQNENKNINSEIGFNDVYTIYPFINFVKPSKIDSVAFSLNLFIYFDSIWGNDTLSLKEKFTFFIPIYQIKTGRFNPVSKITEKIISPTQLDSTNIETRLKMDNGYIMFGWEEGQIKDSIYYFIPKDSIVLLYRAKERDIIFQKLFDSGEVLTINKQITNQKNHIVAINWFKNNFTLYVNGDSATNIIRQKVTDIP